MRAMRVTNYLTNSDTLLHISPNRSAQKSVLAIPSVFQKWLCTTPQPLICVQDIVHVGVKLKCCLLKPSIILPLGSFLATSSHLHILARLLGKDQHGLRSRDLDHKDKQNFAAVEHIIKASSLLDSIPGSLGTKTYINVMSSAVNSYLDKSLSPKIWLEEIWYSIFFMRYW